MDCCRSRVRRALLPVLSRFVAWSTVFAIVPLVFAKEPESIDLSKLPAAVEREIDFEKDIKPIFENSCYDCHGPDAQEAGLRLDFKKKAMGGSDSGTVIAPGKLEESLLLHRVAGLNEEHGRMPPEDAGDALSTDQIALLRTWIERGATWPDDATEAPTTSDLWSVQPIVRPPVPAVQNAAWVRNPIDAFVLAKLEQESVQPSPEASRATLLRRLYLDLIGLPPTLEETEAFLNDTAPDAYEKVVDYLLDSPHYGERWGRHWLDAARYADSDGYEKDLIRPFAWRYRDWVIEALNRDMPFDVFTVQQIAGDLLQPSDPEYGDTARIATGFHRNTLLNLEGGVDPEEDRVKRTIDRTNTTGTVWMGLTVGCANCHTHKYDPITQREYFQLYAFFNNMKEVDIAVDPRASEVEQPEQMPEEMLPEEVTKEPEVQVVAASSSDTGGASGDAKSKKKKKPSQAEGRMASAMTKAQAVQEQAKARETFVHLRGDFLSNGPKVMPATLEVLPKLSSRKEAADRLDLARWLVSSENPLTARVTANRLWQWHFGRGIVSTGEDFGTQGDAPSHPELLDWLASELQDGGWRLKNFHKLIVTSATYRQTSNARPELEQRDPYNTWLARQNRLRVEAELVRDLGLSVSGLLYPRVGGPSVRPPQPAGVSEVTYASGAKWEESVGRDRYRRGMYVWFQRTSPYPSSIVFDAPDANISCTRRERSNTPLQALTVLNDAVFVEFANQLGERILNESTKQPPSGDVVQERIRYGFKLCLARDPNERELAILRKLYETALTQTNNTDPVAGTPDERACMAVARTLLNLDEFLTRE